MDIGTVVSMCFVWIVLLTSIILLMTKTEVFLGNKFSSEKCEIYTMFVTLTIGYLASVIINSLLVKSNSSFKHWFNDNTEGSMTNEGLLFVLLYSLIS
jgi:hypothetical protein